MSPKDLLLHLRIPFSFFLMPVFWLALSHVQLVNQSHAIWIFLILHVFIYPASNAYNSYIDKDEGSIGGLKTPPKVDIKLFWTSVIVDAIGIFLSLIFISLNFAFLILIYSLVSRAYSWSGIRLKKYPIISWLTVGFFQGGYIFMLVYNYTELIPWSERHDLSYTLQHFMESPYFPALLSSIMLWAVYPMTQVYQHKEDAAHGDTTLSIKLGIKGTFMFTGFFFTLAFFGFYLYFGLPNFWLFVLFNLPTFGFFSWWFLKVLQNEEAANFKNTMLLNLLASFCLNAFYIWLFIGI